MAKPIKLMIVDDHDVVLVGLAKIFDSEKDIQIVGQAKDGAQAVEQALALKPDIVLMDIYLPRVNGLEAMKAMKKNAPDTKVIFLTVSQREEDLFQALRLGANGYLLKTCTPTELVDAIRRSYLNENVLSPSLAGKLVKEFRHMNDEVPLSAKEKQVLLLLGDGLNNTEIASRLFIGESTVRTYLHRLFEKLHLRNRVQAATYAREHMIPPSNDNV